jgi:hypothetical protein
MVFEDGMAAQGDQNQTVLVDPRQQNSKVRTGQGGWNRSRYEDFRRYSFGVAPNPVLKERS